MLVDQGIVEDRPLLAMPVNPSLLMDLPNGSSRWVVLRRVHGLDRAQVGEAQRAELGVVRRRLGGWILGGRFEVEQS